MANFSAPPIRTPFLGNPPEDLSPKNVPSFPWQSFFQAITTFLSGPQIPLVTPASSTATGTTGAITYDANFLYICVAKNTWKRIALTAF